MQPDPDVMMKFLIRLFGNQLTGRVELAWSDPGKAGRICHGQSFHLDCLEDLVNAAVEANRGAKERGLAVTGLIWGLIAGAAAAAAMLLLRFHWVSRREVRPL